MKCLVVIAHPIADSLCQTMARSAISTLTAGGHQVEIEDLYLSGFSPALTVGERQSYYSPTPTCDSGAVRDQIKRLLAAEGLELVFNLV